jgi:hypothetical protein
VTSECKYIWHHPYIFKYLLLLILYYKSWLYDHSSVNRLKQNFIVSMFFLWFWLIVSQFCAYTLFYTGYALIFICKIKSCLFKKIDIFLELFNMWKQWIGWIHIIPNIKLIESWSIVLEFSDADSNGTMIIEDLGKNGN